MTFLKAEGGRVAYQRSLEGNTIRIYVNRSGEDWDISGEKMLLGHELRHMAPGAITLAPGGWCITEV